MNKIAASVEKIRRKNPLVLHVTNSVSINDCANTVACLGGSPMMTFEPKEIDEIAQKSSAVVINIGTMGENEVSNAVSSGKSANDAGIPVILDPVGVGISEHRQKIVKKLFSKVEISVVKGNSAEIGFLSEGKSNAKGVDSKSTVNPESVKNLSISTGAIICASGKTDIISDGKNTLIVSNGTGLMGKVVGTGCMLTSAVGCFAGSIKSDLPTVAYAVASFDVAGEIATEKADGTGTFKPLFFDALDKLDDETVNKKLKVEKWKPDFMS